MSLEEKAVINKTVNLYLDEAKKIWAICEKMGYKRWAPCLRHLLIKCLETKCYG
jgi:hypothetical protein